jgi:hypothetical protein
MSQIIAPTLTQTLALPPGPRVPVWWQTFRSAGDPLGVFDECHRRYGDAFTLKIAAIAGS